MDRPRMFSIGLLAATLFLGQQALAESPTLVLPKHTPDDHLAGFRPLDIIFRDKSVVQLGESIHMTNELPTARLPFVKYLHQQHGFDLVILEGSAIESWMAADLLLNSKVVDDKTLRQARDVALPFIWRTEPYTELYRYAWQTLRSKRPLYLASYDLQPGMGSLRAEILTKLRQAIAAYLPEPERVKAAGALFDLLADRSKGFPNAVVFDVDALNRAIAEFETWVCEAASLVDEKFPDVPHGRMLRQLPGAMRLQVELWSRHRSDPEKQKFLAFQEARDRLGAGMVMKMKDDVSRSGKVLVWAHQVHIFHNTLGKARHSLGSDLKSWLGTKMYTVGGFVGKGTFLGFEGDEDIQLTDLGKTAAPGLEGSLKVLASEDYFLDFATVKDAKLRGVLDAATTTRREGGAMPVLPAKDFDGALFIQSVTPPQLPK